MSSNYCISRSYSLKIPALLTSEVLARYISSAVFPLVSFSLIYLYNIGINQQSKFNSCGLNLHKIISTFQLLLNFKSISIANNFLKLLEL